MRKISLATICSASLAYIGMGADDGDRRVWLWIGEFSCHQIAYTPVGDYPLYICNDEYLVAFMLIRFSLSHSCKVDVTEPWDE